MSDELPDHVRRNRAEWDRMAPDWVQPGRFLWGLDEPVWGNWRVPEAQVGMLAGELDGLDAIELGCGTGYVSAWLARRGARPVGIDNSRKQLDTARQLQSEFGLDFPLLHGNAEQVPLPDASFHFAISEYGASIWCDPYAWIPEAARLLRPGGRPGEPRAIAQRVRGSGSSSSTLRSRRRPSAPLSTPTCGSL